MGRFNRRALFYCSCLMAIAIPLLSGSGAGVVIGISDRVDTNNFAPFNQREAAILCADENENGNLVVAQAPPLPPPLGQLPHGVTLKPIDGGPNYYGDNGFTYAHNAGWDDP